MSFSFRTRPKIFKLEPKKEIPNWKSKFIFRCTIIVSFLAPMLPNNQFRSVPFLGFELEKMHFCFYHIKDVLWYHFLLDKSSCSYNDATIFSSWRWGNPVSSISNLKAVRKGLFFLGRCNAGRRSHPSTGRRESSLQFRLVNGPCI